MQPGLDAIATRRQPVAASRAVVCHRRRRDPSRSLRGWWLVRDRAPSDAACACGGDASTARSCDRTSISGASSEAAASTTRSRADSRRSSVVTGQLVRATFDRDRRSADRRWSVPTRLDRERGATADSRRRSTIDGDVARRRACAAHESACPCGNRHDPCTSGAVFAVQSERPRGRSCSSIAARSSSARRDLGAGDWFGPADDAIAGARRAAARARARGPSAVRAQHDPRGCRHRAGTHATR